MGISTSADNNGTLGNFDADHNGHVKIINVAWQSNDSVSSDLARGLMAICFHGQGTTRIYTKRILVVTCYSIVADS